ncbi:MAG: dihydroorotase [Coxiella sp. (in: Bacteria)]|nr:MAG: dihydroorotase [Coxiella sp. (in: g-proteobacteria)]
MQKITFAQPDDWHCHLRDGASLLRTVPDTCRFFKRAIIMPNLTPPVTTVAAAQAYYERIVQAVPQHAEFTPLMTLYLSQQMDPQEIQRAAESDIIYACKLYPKGATTNSESGIQSIKAIYPLLEAMQTHQLPLLIHGEIADDNADIFDREKEFIAHTLTQLLKDFPQLKIVLEHISTREAVDFIMEGPDNLAATITAHHLLLNRNDILAGGIKPHNYCLPIVKRESDRLALIKAATSANPKFFLGTDSAPHTLETKHTSCGCAGIYTAYHAIPLYLDVFDKAGALPHFEAFASLNGAHFYGLPVNTNTVTFIKKTWEIPETLPFGDSTVVPLLAGHPLQWQYADE